MAPGPLDAAGNPVANVSLDVSDLVASSWPRTGAAYFDVTAACVAVGNCATTKVALNAPAAGIFASW